LIGGDPIVSKQANDKFAEYQRSVKAPKKREKKYASYIIMRPTDVVPYTSLEFLNLIHYPGRSSLDEYGEMNRLWDYNNNKKQ
jgi:hypothetical protein